MKDVVKLIVQYVDDVAELDMTGERMWVKVTGRKEPYLVRILSNQPIGQDDNGWPITWGDRVHFLPEHIIAIER